MAGAVLVFAMLLCLCLLAWAGHLQDKIDRQEKEIKILWRNNRAFRNAVVDARLELHRLKERDTLKGIIDEPTYDESETVVL
jgi:Tfp pilus assembly protein PilN